MWRAQATAEGLTLLVANNKAGYLGVYLKNPSHPKPYQVEMRRGGKKVHLGSFATAEEAALCVARTPEGQVAAGRAASADSQGTLPAVPPPTPPASPPSAPPATARQTAPPPRR